MQPAENWRHQKKLHTYLGKQGKLLVWTVIHVAPSGFEGQTPYLSGIVLFEDGEKLPVEIVDCLPQDLKVNQKVGAIIRKVGKSSPEGVINYGIKVKPL